MQGSCVVSLSQVFAPARTADPLLSLADKVAHIRNQLGLPNAPVIIALQQANAQCGVTPVPGTSLMAQADALLAALGLPAQTAASTLSLAEKVTLIRNQLGLSIELPIAAAIREAITQCGPPAPGTSFNAQADALLEALGVN